LISHYRLTGVLKTLEPLHIGSGRRTGVIKHSLPYIPGSFIRGAVGTALVKAACKLERPSTQHEECEYFEECAYTRIFGGIGGKTSKIFIRYAYPVHLGCGGTYRPAPKTLYRCDNSQCGRLYDTLSPPDRCKTETCEGRVKPYRGFICDKCGAENSRPVSLLRTTSTAIDRGLSTAAMVQNQGQTAGTLHTIEAIPRGAKFQLDVILHRDLEEELGILEAIFARALPEEGLGGSKSRGYGKVSVEGLKIEPVETGDIEKRADEIDVTNFSVQALSPLLLGGVLEPRTLLEGARRAYSWVFHEGKPQLPEVSLEASRLALEPHGGWSLKEGRQRRLEHGIAAGSVFQYRCTSVDSVLALAVAALEVYPVGDYKPHGCGQLRVEQPRPGG